MACLQLYWRLSDEPSGESCFTNTDGSWRTWRQGPVNIGTHTNMDRVIAAWLRALLDDVQDRSKMAAKNPKFAGQQLDVSFLTIGKFDVPEVRFGFLDTANYGDGTEESDLIGSNDAVVMIHDVDTDSRIYFDCDSTEIEPLIAMLEGGF